MTSRLKDGPVELAKGQLWKTEEAYIEVVEVKRLIHYRILRQPGQRLVRTRMSSPADFEQYLKKHHAGLVANTER